MWRPSFWHALALFNLILLFFSYMQIKNTQRKVLVTFVAAGKSPQKATVIKRNLDLLLQQVPKSAYKVDCQILAYAGHQELPAWLTQHDSPYNVFCPLIIYHKQIYVFFLKTLQPKLLRLAGYSYVFIILDDVALYPSHGNFQLSGFLSLVEDNHLVMASPGIKNSVWDAMLPQYHAFSSGRFVDMIEIQATLFRLDAWECMFSLIDTEFPSGWGIDLWFYYFCVDSGILPKNSIGVIDLYEATHDPYGEGLPNNYSRKIMIAQEMYWQRHRNISLRRSYMRTLGHF
jgi:hypothetical protein